ncbi:hypothetical protein [Nitrospirillum pindoramense]|uniref:Uncharacterized protein n=1 Tax=Nitrospirillum amazonense TaxID=28077 RepID=A0A560HJK6_9PROT|nr:hypothetical protein [Nitrospirillum amazonense]TWB45719.1 hypothetical protein FBZ90_10151 [Nitrospirillum amazonense]
MTTVRSVLTGLFLGLPFLVAPAILVAAPRPDVATVAQAAPLGPTPAATLAASKSGRLTVIPAQAVTTPGASRDGLAVPCKATGTSVIKAHAGHSVPHRLIALN